MPDTAEQTRERTETSAEQSVRLAPYLSLAGAAKGIEFYKTAFGAEELERYDYQGKIGHATLRINGAIVNLADEFPEHEALIGHVAPATLGGRTTFTTVLYVEDADVWFDRAIAAGATEVRACSDEFYGRQGKVRDPFGYVWALIAVKRPASA